MEVWGLACKVGTGDIICNEALLGTFLCQSCGVVAVVGPAV